jgi:hypothetical protein
MVSPLFQTYSAGDLIDARRAVNKKMSTSTLPINASSPPLRDRLKNARKSAFL